jgi:hypothetical protein
MMDLNELRLDEFKKELRSFILNHYDLDIGVEDYIEFIEFDVAVFRNSYSDYLSEDELFDSEIFFISSRNFYFNCNSHICLKGFVESPFTVKFREIHKKLSSLGVLS